MGNSVFLQFFSQTLPWVCLFILMVALVHFIHYTIFNEDILKLFTRYRLRDIWNRIFHGITTKPTKFSWALEIFALSIAPVFFSGTEINNTVLDKITGDLNFAAISIALATYIATVRLYLIGRLEPNSSSRNPKLIKATIITMIPADFNLILSAVFIAMKYFFNSFPDFLVNLSAVAFLYAVSYLALQHLIAWIISFYKLIGY